jgi:TatD DNase family protein
MMDMHCHIDLYKNPLEIIEKSVAAKLYVLSVTTTPKAWEGTYALSKNASRFQTSLGLHPQLAHVREHELALFDLLMDRTRFIGEIGLDGSKEYRVHFDAQLRVFRHILNACKNDNNKIFTVHSRLAVPEVLKELANFSVAGKVILHWYMGTKAEMMEAVKLGCYFSVGPAMIDSSRGKKILSWLPKDRILLETDGPFAKINGISLEPVDVYKMVEYFSSNWTVSIEDVNKLLLNNLNSLVTT